MVDKSGQVKVIDFGIAKAESDPNLTIAGTACGTPAYMAPEQFTPTADTNYALVDVYAAGTTLYYMLTGSLPYQADNEFAMRDAKLFSDPIKPRAVNPGIPKEIEEIILRSIHKDPQKRYQSTQQMRDALMRIEKTCDSGDEKTQAVVATGEQKTAGRERRSSGRSLLVKVIPVAVIILIAVFAVYKFVLTPGPGPTPGSQAVVHLLSPASGEVLSAASMPALTWEPAAGPDGSYILEYARDSLFTDSKTIAGIPSGSYTFSSALDNGDYYWRIYPVSREGARGGPSQAFEFTVNPSASTIPTTPATVSMKGRLALQMSPSADVYVNNNLLARNQKSASATLDTGTYVLRVENKESQEKVKYDTVRISGQGTVRRDYRFTVPPPKPAEPLGEVRIGSKPRGADITIDGELQKQQTNYTFRLKPGMHIIKTSILFGDVSRVLTDTVQVQADSTYKLLFDFEQ
jgi:hypothetical protein